MFRSDLNRSLRDYCVIEATWLVTGSFRKQSKGTHTVLLEICGTEFFQRSGYQPSGWGGATQNSRTVRSKKKQLAPEALTA